MKEETKVVRDRNIIFENFIETNKFDVKLVRYNTNTEFPQTLGMLIKNKRTNLYTLSKIEVPEDEYGSGSLPKKVDSIREFENGDISVWYTFETGARMDWEEVSYHAILPKPNINAKEIISNINEFVKRMI